MAKQVVDLALISSVQASASNTSIDIVQVGVRESRLLVVARAARRYSQVERFTERAIMAEEHSKLLSSLRGTIDAYTNVW
jgi:hypothetical protein